MKYRTNDGETFDADNSRAAVNELRALSRDPEPNVELFKEAVAVRVQRQTGRTIRVASNADFIQDLITVGLLEKLEDDG